MPFKKQFRRMLRCVPVWLGCLLPSSNGPAPLMLDSIHYFVNDARAARYFFTRHFGAQVLAKPEKNPLPHVEYLEIRPGQAAVALSAQGPFPGLNAQDPARWKRQPVRMAATTPPVYGVHWLALRTESLKHALAALEKEGVKIAAADVSVPGDPLAKAALLWGPEFTRILLVQRGREHRQETFYGLDHLLVLVEDLAAETKFFQEVYAGKVQKREADFCRLLVGGHVLVLARPHAIGLPESTVHRLDSAQFRPGIEELGFLYADPQPAYHAAALKGHSFSLRPSRLIYRNKPTPYTTALTRSPGGIYCQMVAEDGREGPRTVYLKTETGAVSGNKK